MCASCMKLTLSRPKPKGLTCTSQAYKFSGRKKVSTQMKLATKRLAFFAEKNWDRKGE